MCVPVGDAEELLLSIWEEELAREWREDEFVGVTPCVKESCRGKPCDPFSKGVGQCELVWQERGCRQCH